MNVFHQIVSFMSGMEIYVYIIAIVVLVLIAVAIVRLLLAIKRKDHAEEAIGSYYSNLSTDEILGTLKNMNLSQDENAMRDRLLELNRKQNEQKTEIAGFEKRLNDFIEMQGSISKSTIHTQEACEEKIASVQEQVNRYNHDREETLRSETETDRKKLREDLSYVHTRIDHIDKEIETIKDSIKDRKEYGGTELDRIFKSQEILSARLSTLNEHLNNQKIFIEKKFQNAHETHIKSLNTEKDLNLLKSSFQDLQGYIQDQLSGIRRDKQFGGDAGFKEFGDLIKEKTDNFFEERQNQLQKIEINLSELMNMDRVKQNVLMRLQKEFSDRLSDVNERISELKNNFSAQSLSEENIKHHLLELEKVIQDLKSKLQEKQNELFNKDDIRFTALESRFSGLSKLIDQKEKEIGHQHIVKNLEKHDSTITMLQEELSKIKKYAHIRQADAPPAHTPENVEKQIRELKSMVYSLIDSLKE